jgi:uncharacterized membrane protein
MREILYKFAIWLSIILVADGIFMAWALYKGGFSMLGYGQISYIPVFMPALLVSLVVVGFYIHGFMRRSWTARGAERAFFVLLTLAVTAKVIVAVRRWS